MGHQKRSVTSARCVHHMVLQIGSLHKGFIPRLSALWKLGRAYNNAIAYSFLQKALQALLSNGNVRADTELETMSNNPAPDDMLKLTISRNKGIQFMAMGLISRSIVAGSTIMLAEGQQA